MGVKRGWILALSLLFSWPAVVTADPGEDGDDDRGQGQRGKPTARFQRVATFPVYRNSEIANQTLAEIIAATPDGNTLLYTDSELEALGFVDITDPADPQPLGKIDLPGEPTSVAVAGKYALVCVNTSADFVNTSGQLIVIRVADRSVVRTLELGGQPDSIAVSPDERFAAVAIENERDEDLGDGRPPQMPAGFVVVIDLIGSPAWWMTRRVDLTGLADKFPEDPEPEFVDINHRNIAAVTLQENNHMVLIDLAHRRWLRYLLQRLGWPINGALIQNDFSLGNVAQLDRLDVIEDSLIETNGVLFDIPREPDAVTWIGNDYLATADEGDLDGGSRGFTIFSADGSIVYESGNHFEHLTMSIGHYPEHRSENKGAEPEGALFARYRWGNFLFIGSERANVVGVYELPRRFKGRGPIEPKFVQVLPTGLGPEGLLAIPHRNLFIASGEEDNRDDKYRGTVTIFELRREAATYPTLQSAFVDGAPIPWAGLSGLATDPNNADVLYTLHDSVFVNNRIYKIDLSQTVPTIVSEIVIRDQGQPISLDPEGIAVRQDGKFWIACEGDDRPPVPNRLLLVDTNGDLLEEVQLPSALQAVRTNNGFEGVTVVEDGKSEKVFVCIQREWDDEAGFVKIGCYDAELGRDLIANSQPIDAAWTFALYPLEEPTSPLGGWVGLSELTSLGQGEFGVIERDNQAGDDARIKLITKFSIEGVEFQPYGSTLPKLSKSVVRDLLGDLAAPGGAILEKQEGLTVDQAGNVWIVNDNDGVDDSSGETQLQNLGPIFD